MEIKQKQYVSNKKEIIARSQNLTVDLIHLIHTLFYTLFYTLFFIFNKLDIFKPFQNKSSQPVVVKMYSIFGVAD